MSLLLLLLDIFIVFCVNMIITGRYLAPYMTRHCLADFFFPNKVWLRLAFLKTDNFDVEKPGVPSVCLRQFFFWSSICAWMAEAKMSIMLLPFLAEHWYAPKALHLPASTWLQAASSSEEKYSESPPLKLDISALLAVTRSFLQPTRQNGLDGQNCFSSGSHFA